MRFNRGYAHSIAINSNYKKFKNYNLKKINCCLYWRYCFHGDIAFKEQKKCGMLQKIITYICFVFLIFYLFNLGFNKKKLKNTY